MAYKGYSKYRAKKVKIDGITFDSKKEGKRYQELKFLAEQGLIEQFEIKPCFSLFSKSGAMVCKYIPDFAYIEQGNPKRVIEDVKGMKTQVYKIKAKWFQADYPEFDFRES